jgi:hypothetical protein
VSEAVEALVAEPRRLAHLPVGAERARLRTERVRIERMHVLERAHGTPWYEPDQRIEEPSVKVLATLPSLRVSAAAPIMWTIR